MTNTALIPTNASMQTGEVLHVESGQTMPWYIGSTESNFSMEGQATESIIVTLVHPDPPAPGTYRIDLLAQDVVVMVLELNVWTGVEVWSLTPGAVMLT